MSDVENEVSGKEEAGAISIISSIHKQKATHKPHLPIIWQHIIEQTTVDKCSLPYIWQRLI